VFSIPNCCQGGVKICKYRGMLHAKAMLPDDDAVLCGSANLDTRSFRLDFELSTFVVDVGLNRDLASLLESIQADFASVGLHDVRHVFPVVRLHDAVAHLLTPLL
jgi:cardiolipin synthase A/B